LHPQIVPATGGRSSNSIPAPFTLSRYPNGEKAIFEPTQNPEEPFFLSPPPSRPRAPPAILCPCTTAIP
jgi:hypothetical protein